MRTNIRVVDVAGLPGCEVEEKISCCIEEMQRFGISAIVLGVVNNTQVIIGHDKNAAYHGWFHSGKQSRMV